MPGEASLSQELPTPELLQAQVLVGYRWQNIGLGPDDSVPTVTEATSCRNFPNRTGPFQGIRLSRQVVIPSQVFCRIHGNTGTVCDLLP
jgi:hypothetical protein